MTLIHRHSFTVSKTRDELSLLFIEHEDKIDGLWLEDDRQSCDLLLSILLRQCADDSGERYSFLKDQRGLLCSHDLFKTELDFEDLERLNLVYNDEQNHFDDSEEFLT